MADAAEVGRYGTIRLVKRQEPDAVIASFPVDDDSVTFGRDPECSVRLYYAWVSPIHCKILFEERKAFLQVLGTNGIVIDGCQVFPAKPPATTPTTVPLVNNSTFEIHKKRFLFTYPPKDLRPVLLATPAAKRHGTLRMSMIHSAQVFTPRPSPNPKENLRVLQSPLKPFGGRKEGVRLVNGDHPRVVEEGQDLVILEDVLRTPMRTPMPDPPSPSPAPRVVVPTPVIVQQQPKTPRRRSAPSLHKAVLLRSAHRIAVMQQAQELGVDEDDDKEEEEVEEAVSAEMVDSGSEEEEEEDYEPSWSDAAGYEQMVEEQDITDANGEGIEHDEHASEPEHRSPSTPVPALNRHLGAFMTPQARTQPSRDAPRTGPQRPPPGSRFSLAPQEPWSVNDILVALRTEGEVKQQEDGDKPARLTSPTKSISEEEKQAIRDRRKLALVMPDPALTHVPGTRRTSVLPSPPHSPFKTRDDAHVGDAPEEEEDTKSLLARMKETVDSMRRKSVAGRQSLGFARGATPSPVQQGFSLLAPSPGGARGGVRGGLFGFGAMERVVLEETFSHVREAEEDEIVVPDDDMDMEDDADHGIDESDDQGEPDDGQSAEEPLADFDVADTVEERDVDEDMAGVAYKQPTISDLVPHAPKAPHTPSFRGMREMFHQRAEAATPQYTGIREMYPVHRTPATPQMDGMHALFAHPEPVSVDAPPKREMKAPAGRRAGVAAPRVGVRRAATREVVAVATPTDVAGLADDEATPEARVAPDGVAEGAIVRRGRPKRADVGDDRVAKPKLAGSRIAKVVKAKAAARDEATGGEDDGDSAAAQKIPMRRLKAKPAQIGDDVETSSPGATTNGDEDASSELLAPKVAKAPRKARVKTETMESDLSAPTPAPAKPPRRARAKTADESEASTSAPTPAARRARAKPIDVDAESNNDPLDTIDRATGADAVEPGVAKARRTTKAKQPVTAEAVDEEPAKRTTKARGVAGADAEDGTGKEEAQPAKPRKTPARRGAAAKAAPKGASAAASDDGLDKENAPDTPGDEQQTSSGKPKGARSRVGAKVKTEEDMPAVPAARVTRARTRK